MSALITNNAVTTLPSAITSGATSIVVATGTGALFPSPSGSDWFAVTLVDISGNLEIVKCTARTLDTLTCVRGQEGTTARAFGVGSKMELRATAAVFNNKLDKDTGGTVNGNVSIVGVLDATSVTQGGAPLMSASSTVVFSNKTIDTANGNVIKVNGNTLSAAAGTATITLPNTNDTLVGRATTDTLSNKTIDTVNNTIKVNGNTLSATAGTATITIPNATTTLVGTTTTDTLVNKTIDGALNHLTIHLGSDVTGVLPIALGGTGQTTGPAALTALGGMLATAVGVPQQGILFSYSGAVFSLLSSFGGVTGSAAGTGLVNITLGATALNLGYYTFGSQYSGGRVYTVGGPTGTLVAGNTYQFAIVDSSNAALANPSRVLLLFY